MSEYTIEQGVEAARLMLAKMDPDTEGLRKEPEGEVLYLLSRTVAALRAENERLRATPPRAEVDVEAVVRDVNRAFSDWMMRDSKTDHRTIDVVIEDALRTALSAATKAGGSPRAPGGAGGDRG